MKKKPKKANNKQLKGVVVSDKMDKTVSVKVTRVIKHPIYKKRYRVFKKYLAHDEENKFKIGDKVIIEQTKPLSKRKKWKAIKKSEKTANKKVKKFG